MGNKSNLKKTEVITFLYLDDEKEVAVRPFIQLVESRGNDKLIPPFNIRINLRLPGDYGDQIDQIHAKANLTLNMTANVVEGEEIPPFNALILDLRLDQFPGWHGGKTRYRATTLAQEIRTRSTEREMAEIPIILWSTDQRLKDSFIKDMTGHDLFDLKCRKDDLLIPEIAKDTARKLLALVIGYREILNIRSKHTSRNLYRYLGFDELPAFLDPRIEGYFVGRKGVIPAHETARFVREHVLESSGVLIDEDILAARLGVDKANSPGWTSLLKKIADKASYTGIFHQGWPRWWWNLVESQWNKKISSSIPLQFMSANERVVLINRALKVEGIRAIENLEEDYSSNFWTTCLVTGRPLDPVDGFLAERKSSFPWEESRYILKGALLEGLHSDLGIKIDPLDAGRFERFKKISSLKKI